MTEDNREENARAELERARQCLAEARMLAANGFPYGAASRGYYAVFHAARALLFSAGLEARSHRGAVVLVGKHFVTTGKLSSELGRLLSRMQRDREDADYATGALFTDREAQQAVGNAERFLEAVERICGF